MKLDKEKAKENPKITEMEHEWKRAHGILENAADNDFDKDCDFITA
jgi:hypothetical protein